MSACRWMTYVKILLLVAAMLGCSTGEKPQEALNIHLYSPTETNENPFDFIAYIRMTVTSSQLSEPLEQLFSKGKSLGKIENIPFGTDVRITIEGLSVNPTGPVVARGRTPKLSIIKGQKTAVNMLFSKVNSFHTTIRSEDSTPSEMLNGRIGFSLTNLKDGRVLIVGGAKLTADGSINDVLDRIEIYDPSSGTFSEPEGGLKFPRVYHTATLLNNGRVLIAGGLGFIETTPGEKEIQNLRFCEIFDPDAASSTKGPELNQKRAFHTATLTSSGMVILIGGEDLGGSTVLKSVEAYDPDSNTLSSFTDIVEARAEHAAVYDPESDRIVIVGGRGQNNALASTEFYDNFTANGDVTEGPALRFARIHHWCSLFVAARTLIITGGYSVLGNRSSPVDAVELLDLTSGALLDQEIALNEARGDHQAIALDQWRVIIFGGYNGSKVLKSAEIITLQKDSTPDLVALETASMVHSRFLHEAILMDTDMVLILGGVEDASSMSPLTSSEVFNPKPFLE